MHDQNGTKIFLAAVVIVLILWLIGNEIRYQFVKWIDIEIIKLLVEAVWYVISFCAMLAVGPVSDWLRSKLNKRKSSSI